MVITDTSGGKTTLALIVQQLNIEDGPVNWGSIIHYFYQVLSVVDKIETLNVDWRNTLRSKEIKANWLLKDEKAKKKIFPPRKVKKVELDWGSLNDIVHVKLRYILIYADERVLVYKGPDECHVDLALLK